MKDYSLGKWPVPVGHPDGRYDRVRIIHVVVYGPACQFLVEKIQHSRQVKNSIQIFLRSKLNLTAFSLKALL